MPKVENEKDAASPAGIVCTVKNRFHQEEHAAKFLYPPCAFCGAALGCSNCQGNDYRVSCPNCRHETNLMPFYRTIAKPTKASAKDYPGIVRFTPSGICMIVEGDGMMRPCRLDEPPIKRIIHVSPTGAYLDDEGYPLFPEDWPVSITAASVRGAA
jgi:hypothetical protein